MFFNAANPKCEKVGCGEWKPPVIDNPAYKGKWSAPLIDNPNFKVNQTSAGLQMILLFPIFKRCVHKFP